MKQAYFFIMYGVGYMLFFLLLWCSKEGKANRLLDKNGFVSNSFLLLVLHVGGIFLFGMVCPYFSDHRMADIVFGEITDGNNRLVITVLFISGLIIFVPVLAEKIYGLLNVHNAATPLFSRAFVTQYFFIRMLFIAAYETWFRGYLLQDCIAFLGIPVALILNTVLYTLLHIINSKKEMIACILFGWLLCIFCIQAEGAWPAILLHTAVAVWYDANLSRRIKKLFNSLA